MSLGHLAGFIPIKAVGKVSTIEFVESPNPLNTPYEPLCVAADANNFFEVSEGYAYIIRLCSYAAYLLELLSFNTIQLPLLVCPNSHPNADESFTVFTMFPTLITHHIETLLLLLIVAKSDAKYPFDASKK